MPVECIFPRVYFVYLRVYETLRIQIIYIIENQIIRSF
jgi:hypothetical protein